MWTLIKYMKPILEEELGFQNPNDSLVTNLLVVLTIKIKKQDLAACHFNKNLFKGQQLFELYIGLSIQACKNGGS